MPDVLPGAQGAQRVAPAVELYEPAAHGEHEVAPDELL